jgi:hypothetical protein
MAQAAWVLRNKVGLANDMVGHSFEKTARISRRVSDNIRNLGAGASRDQLYYFRGDQFESRKA